MCCNQVSASNTNHNWCRVFESAIECLNMMLELHFLGRKSLAKPRMPIAQLEWNELNLTC